VFGGNACVLFNSTKSVWKKVGFLLFLSLFHGGCLKIGAAFLINIGWLGVHRVLNALRNRQNYLWRHIGLLLLLLLLLLRRLL